MTIHNKEYSTTKNKLFNYAFYYCLVAFLCLMLTSCYSVKNYTQGSTLIVTNTIKNTNALSINPYQNALISNAYASIEESVFPKAKQRLPYWYILKAPPKFDELKIALSAQNINNYINANGYFDNTISYQTVTKKKSTYTRADIIYNVQFNQPYYVNTIRYSLSKDVEQSLQKQQANNELTLIESEIFNTVNLETTIGQIVQAHKELGYYKIKTDDIKVELDTLINQYRGKYKYVNVRFYYQENLDSTALQQFFIDKIYFITNHKTTDTIDKKINFDSFKNVWYAKDNNILKPKVLWLFNNLEQGKFFTESAYQQNIQNLYRLNIWNTINLKTEHLMDTFLFQKKYSRISFYYLLEKAPEYNFNVETGFSYNFFPLGFQDVNFVNQNSWGLNFSSIFTIKNTFKKAIETTVSARAALESIITTSNFSFATIDINTDFSQKIPWLFPFNIYKTTNTILSSDYAIGGRLTERINFYTLTSVNAKLSWNIENQKKHFQIEVKPTYISLMFLNKTQRFLDNEAQNPYLKYGFNEGFTAGINASITKQFFYNRLPHYSSVLNIFVEESGSTWAFPISLQTAYPIFQYVKLSGSLSHQIKFLKQSWHARIKAGYGHSYGQDSIVNKTLPFFKQFFAGGPNSMRAWNSGRLGLGTSSSSDTTDFKDRYGDIALEANLEYRFNLFKINAAKIESCLFIDAGNIWNRNFIATETERSVFDVNKLWKDLAIAGGTGIRLAFSFIVVRLDVGIRIKDPIKNVLSKQFLHADNLQLKNLALQLGIGYPF